MLLCEIGADLLFLADEDADGAHAARVPSPWRDGVFVALRVA